MKEQKTINEKELEILEFWGKNKIFEKSLFENKGNPTFTFYDGPPFATGMPHHGHLLQSYLKDSIPRYQTMKGKYVRRVWGWDTHGLPIENLIEKELGFKNKADIENFGVGKFTKAATDSVLRYEDEWKKIIPRIGRWVDMENRYMTLSNTYTESCWWAFSELYKKGLAYEGFKVMHVCPRCETPLAASEVALGYADVKDISVYAKFELVGEKVGDLPVSLLAWTTTPWTLPGNTAIAVNKSLSYVELKYDNQIFVVAKNLVEKVFENKEGKVVEILSEFLGQELIGKKYKPVFDYYNNDIEIGKLKNSFGESNGQNIYKVWHADFVTDTAGTGIAHEAPAFGEDDYNLAMQNNVPTILHVSMDGRFKDEVVDFRGERVKWKGETQATDKKVCEYLAAQNKILKTEVITHSYPLCWRCDTPLLNYATSSWFVAVSKMRENLVNENKKVYWVPENVRDGRMGQWLEGARDWALSRNRYWGAPLPVWRTVPTLDKGGLGGVLETFIPSSLKDLQTRTKAKNKYILVRHGETDANKSVDTENANVLAAGYIDVVLGQDKSLNANGKEQAKILSTSPSLSLQKRGISAEDVVILSSPYKRTTETAEILASSLGLQKESILSDDRLKEWQVGESNNGKSWGQFYKENVGINYLHHKMSGADETKIDVQNRVASLITELEDKYEGKTIVLVTHKSPIACLLSRNNAELFEVGTKNLPVWHNAKNCEAIVLDWKPLPTDELGAVNFHLPHIDNLKVYDDNGNPMRREGGVFDCWFESGSMPYAQFHYPFENQELFNKSFPADFIAEAQDQTRGWFYTMLVLGVGLFEKSPFKSVICSGHIMADDGKKMSKSLKNYTDPIELVTMYGSDALRYLILSSPVVKSEPFRLKDQLVAQAYSKNITRLLNVLSFYKMYSQKDVQVLGESGSQNVIDKFILARFKEVKSQVTNGFEQLFVDAAFRPIEKFIDDLSVWYLRRSRDRFKSENEEIKKEVLQTTKYVLENFAKVLAPIMPFTAEMIWQEIKNDLEPISVHLTTWGESPDLEVEEVESINKMELAREMVTRILDERVKAGLKVRQPLARVTFKTVKYDVLKTESQYLQEIKDETNILEIIFTDSDDSVTVGKDCELDTNLTEDLKIEGVYRELVRLIQDKRKQESLKVADRVSIVLDEKLSDFEKQVIEIKKSELQKECGLVEISFGPEFLVLK